MKENTFYPALKDYCQSLLSELSHIFQDRKVQLEKLGDILIEKLKNNQPVHLLFICTHNSRRSHFGQLWSITAGQYYGINNIFTYSGGTESTGFHPKAIKAIKKAGFSVECIEECKTNPKYRVRSGDDYESSLMYSKIYTDAIDPARNYIAILVCADAHEACPVVVGAEKRVYLPYEDPQKYDHTPLEFKIYDERCRQIAREMFYCMDYIRSSLI